MQEEIIDLKTLEFPIGKFTAPSEISEKHIQSWIATIKDFPSRLNTLCNPLSKEQLNWKYRPNGWNIQQVVHHCADSHMNGIIRTKLALTEDNPTIKPYPEHLWAELEDYQVNMEMSLQIIQSVHFKWSLLFESISSQQLERSYFHPEDQHSYSIAQQCGLFAWHCNHHFAHIEQALNAQGKFN